ncbi:cupin domain-containing protein [Eudoraea adriatica]|uniref:cupin domain-containing protein n=1 Tax=Eudoraea adriatica TaxID=446681 RepID=UPI0003697057|nr:cupin domain-containing protein [Eudoraea adriatica]
MNSKINIPVTLNTIPNYFSPKIIGEVNDVYIKIVKILGEKVPWHNHKIEDELFYILEGSLEIEIENKPSFQMNKGELYIVKRGVNHKVSSQNECHLMLIENKTALHTGEVSAEITKTIAEQK